MNQLEKVFDYQGKQVRTVIKEGEPWFVARDIAEVLGYSNPQKAIRTHCRKPEAIGVNESGTLDPQTVIIPEHDMYRLTIRSKLPSAMKFEKWVLEEVLPSIRKTGRYELSPSIPALPQTYSEALRMLADKVEENETQKKALAAAAPKIEFAEAVNDSSNSMDLGSFAKILGTGRTRFFEWLREQGYLMRGSNTPYQEYIDNGYFVVIETTFTKGDTKHTYAKTQICGKGQIAIQNKWREEAVSMVM